LKQWGVFIVGTFSQQRGEKGKHVRDIECRKFGRMARVYWLGARSEKKSLHARKGKKLKGNALKNSLERRKLPNGLRIFMFLSIPAIYALVAIVGVAIGRWPFLETFQQRDLAFRDLGVLLSLSDFYLQNPTGNPMDFDWTGTGMTPNYPLLLPRILSFLSIGVVQIIPVGLLLILALSLTLSYLFFRATRFKPTPFVVITGIFAVIWSFSPPFMLLVERGNYDILIFVMVSWAALAASRSTWMSMFLILAASLFKLFPVAASVAFLRFRRGWLLAAIPVAGLVAYVILRPEEFLNVYDSTPRPNWAAFGALVSLSLAHEYLGLGIGVSVAIFALVHIFGIGLYFALRTSLKDDFDDLVQNFEESNSAQNLLFFGSSLVVFIYGLGNSYDYRLIFLTLPVVGILLAVDRISNLVLASLMTSFLVMTWSFPSHQLSPIADLLLVSLLTFFVHVSSTLLWRKYCPPGSKIARSLERIGFNFRIQKAPKDPIKE
jgi:hypothetical protein